jgi:hypothetical protein
MLMMLSMVRRRTHEQEEKKSSSIMSENKLSLRPSEEEGRAKRAEAFP